MNQSILLGGLLVCLFTFSCSVNVEVGSANGKDDNALVLAGCADGYLYAFESGRGAEKWKYNTKSQIYGTVTASDGVAFVGSEDGILHAVNVNDGTKKWSLGLGYSIQGSSVTVSNGTVYACNRSELYSINASTGVLNWKTNEHNSFRTSPVVANGMVYVGGAGNYFQAFDATTGGLKWSTYISGYVLSNPAVVNGVVYLGSYSLPANFYALDATTGKEIWKQTFEKKAEWFESSPTVADGTVYVGNSNMNLYALDTKTGSVRWAIKDFGKVSGSPLVENGVLYNSDYAGVSAYTLSTGSLKAPVRKWEFKDNGRATGALNHNGIVIANYTIYATGVNGEFYSMDQSTGTAYTDFKAYPRGQLTDPCVITTKGKVFNSGESGAVQ